MDDQVVEEDPYSDDDLDALPDNAFHELEENAVRLTQRPPKAAPARLPAFKSPRRPASTTLAGGLGRLSVAHQTVHGPPNGLHQPSSDYGDFDDEMLDGEIFDAAKQPNLAEAIQQNGDVMRGPGDSTQREQWRRQRYGKPEPNLAYQHQQRAFDHQAAGIHLEGNAKDDHVYEHEETPPTEKTVGIPAKTVNNPNDVNFLQLQVEKLVREREKLQQAIQNANDNAYAKAGEIAIVRANASKIEKEYENRTKAMQKLHADEAARQKLEVEKARAELQKIATEKDFLENDLAEGTKQIRNLQKAAKKGDRPSEAKVGGKENGTTTPNRHKVGLGDGFEDDEILPVSPSKLVLRGKVGTPKAGSKRKRKGTEGSPSQQPLELAEPVHVVSFDEPAPAPVPVQVAAISPQPSKPRDANFPFAQKFLDHRIHQDEDRTIEVLARYKLLSQPGKPLSTILLDKMSPLNIRPNVKSLPSAIALEVISIWSQCIKEQYHAPVHLLLDLVRYILITDSFKTAPDLTNSLMSLLQETADILIIPRCQKKPPSPNRALISSTDCLEIMHLMASQLSISRDESTRFWRTMRFDFIMMLLSFIHPLEELNLTIRMLHTSILSSSFAMIIPPGDGKQDATEARVIDNLSRLLVESPRPSQGEPTLTSIELAELRLSILELLDEMGANDYAALALCKHRLLLGRLVRLMNDSLAHAYDYTNAHHYLISLVNGATRLLYYLVTNYPEHINMQQKLSVIPGGEKKFLIVLTRLAFSEVGGLLEGGIEDDVSELAHRMLEERVSPEEAEGLEEAMSTAPATRDATGRRSSRGAGEGDSGG